MQEQQLQQRESIKKIDAAIKKIKSAYKNASQKNDTALMHDLSEKYKALNNQRNEIAREYNKLNEKINQDRNTSCPNLSKLDAILESHKENYSRIHKSIMKIITDLDNKEFNRLRKQSGIIDIFEFDSGTDKIKEPFSILVKNRRDILNEYVKIHNDNFAASTNPDLDFEDITNILHKHYRLLLDFSTSLAIQYNVMPTLNGLVFDKDVDNAFTEKEKDFFRSL